MKSFELDGFYGSGKTNTTIFCYPQRGGTWYVVNGSVNVNFTYDFVEDGVNVEELKDVDAFTATHPITGIHDLEGEFEGKV